MTHDAILFSLICVHSNNAQDARHGVGAVLEPERLAKLSVDS